MMVNDKEKSATVGPMERELLGICKQSMLVLAHELHQYVDQLHAQADINDKHLHEYILMAAEEVSDLVCLDKVLRFVLSV